VSAAVSQNRISKTNNKYTLLISSGCLWNAVLIVWQADLSSLAMSHSQQIPIIPRCPFNNNDDDDDSMNFALRTGGIINTTEGNCEQQIPSIALRLRQLTAQPARQRSCSVYNSCGLTT